MKKILALLLTLVMAISAFAACEKKDGITEAEKGAGAVQTTENVTEPTAPEATEPTEEGEVSDGKLYAVKMTEYDGEGAVKAKYLIEHELEGGKVVKASMVNEAGTVIYYSELEYDGAGKVKKESDYQNNEIYWAKEYVDGVLINEYNYQEGELHSFCQHEYDPKGNLVRSINYHADEVPYNQNEYTYDGHGNMLTDTLYVYAGAIKEVYSSTAYEYELRPDGKPIKKTTDSTVYEYEYDAEGNVSKCSVYYNGKLWETTEYDEYGNVLKESTYGEDGLLRYTVYEYATL